MRMHEEYHFITHQPSQSINEIEFLNTTGSHTQECRFELGLIVLIGPGGELFSECPCRANGGSDSENASWA